MNTNFFILPVQKYRGFYVTLQSEIYICKKT